MENCELLTTFEDGKQLYLCTPQQEFLDLKIGPHLFVDNLLAESFGGFNRVVTKPTRVAKVLDLQSHGVYNFNSSVIKRDKYRIWYNSLDAGVMKNAISESVDGINWSAPIIINGFDNSMINVVLDDGNYKTVVREVALSPRWRGRLFTSVDGIFWQTNGNFVTVDKYGETWSLFRNAVGYGLFHRYNIKDFIWLDGRINTRYEPFVRTIYFTTSPTPLTFPASKPVFVPMSEDEGETQFYSVSNIIKRGSLYIGTLNVLREDLKALNSGEGFGIGYSVLIWSRDGINWQRHKGSDPHFLDPMNNGVAWDNAISWVTSIVEDGDYNLFYYGGYKYGHKIYTDRAIGLAEGKRDRFVSRKTSVTRVLRTKLSKLQGNRLTVNGRGRIRTRVVDVNNVPIPGFNYWDLSVLNGDYLNGLVSSKLGLLSNRLVKIEFELSNAEIWGFYLE